MNEHIPLGDSRHWTQDQTVHRPGAQDFLKLPSLVAGARMARRAPVLTSSRVPANSAFHANDRIEIIKK